MNAGPSKEQLENLFKTSRKYFDELAKEYYAKDRDFYNKNFAPFYRNPLLNSKKGGNSARLVIVAGILALILGLGGILLIFFVQGGTENTPTLDKEKYQETVKTQKDKPASSVKDSLDKDNIRLDLLEEELIQNENTVKQKENEFREDKVFENKGKREVRTKPIERQR